MTTEKRNEIPRYRDLPIDPSKPPGSAWGVFGEEDEVGTINLLTPEHARRAAGLVRKGAVFSLNWSLEKPDPPILNRQQMKHTIIHLDPGTDDYYDNFYTQVSSQWDALSHWPHPEHGYYNGRTLQDFTGKPGSKNGIDNWAERGIVGRYVLADVDRCRLENGTPIRHEERDEITVDEVEAALAGQGSSLGEGDVLLLRTGWIGWYEGTDEATRAELGASGGQLRAPGLSPEERTLEWLWDHRISAVAADCPALEAIPPLPNPDDPSVEGFLHFRIIPLLGMAVGEMFVLDGLAEDCAADGVYEGLFTSAPLNKVGGSGSPANALAIK